MANVAPVFTTFTNNAAEVGNVLPGEPVVLTGVFADPGTQDSYTLIVDWGDGTAAQESRLCRRSARLPADA